MEQNINSNQPNLTSDIQKKTVKTRKFKFFVSAFLALVVLIGGYAVWVNYLSPEARSARETQKNYELYLDWQNNYEKAMREDTYGGKTPEETLKMFIEALKKGDVELASKYFALNTNENSEYYLTRREWEEGLRKIKEGGKLEGVISKLSLVKLTFKDSKGAIFKNYDFKGEIDTLVEIKLNNYSNVWKIESM